MSVPAAPELPGVLAAWSLEPVTVAALASAAVAYGRACRVARALTPRHPVPALAAAGVLRRAWRVVAVALLSPVDTYADALLSVHMVQHVLLTLVAAPLLLLGQPGALALRVVSPERRRRWLRAGPGRLGRPGVVTPPGLDRLRRRRVGHPLLTPVRRRPPVPAGARRPSTPCSSPPPSSSGGRCVGGHPAGRPLPHPVRLLYLGVAMPQNTFLALAVLGADGVLYSHYAEAVRAGDRRRWPTSARGRASCGWRAT